MQNVALFEIQLLQILIKVGSHWSKVVPNQCGWCEKMAMKLERHRENTCDNEGRNWSDAAANRRMSETTSKLPEQAEEGSSTGLRGSIALLSPGL